MALSPVMLASQLTGPARADKQLFVELTKRAGVMVMGRATYDTIGRALPGRQTVVYSRQTLDLPEGARQTAVAPDVLLKQLSDEGYEEIAICGGQGVYSLFMEAGLVDELYLTVEPLLFGTGLGLFNKPLQTTMDLVDSRALAPGVPVCNTTAYVNEHHPS